MRTWVVDQPGPISTSPLLLVERPDPVPAPGEVRIRVHACGVCRTDLHLAEGDLPPRQRHVSPGHEVVGVVDAVGEGAARFSLGQRIGIPWLRATCGRCRYCRTGRENLCSDQRFTGWDEPGGFAEMATVPEAFAYPIPDSFDDVRAAPLLCAGIIGFRALERAQLPPGGRLGIYGFGASAHLTAQVAVHRGASVHVMTRGEHAQRRALEMGLSSAQGAYDPPPEPLDAAILFAPVGTLVVPALKALAPGGTLAIAGIHLSDVPPLTYERHLFHEKTITSVTANTRADGDAFLGLAGEIPIRPTVTTFGFDDTNRALRALAQGDIAGAGVIVMDS